MEKFFKSPAGRHVSSFIKTFVTVFLGICVYADTQGVDVFTNLFLISALKSSTISLFRTGYKLLTEK